MNGPSRAISRKLSSECRRVIETSVRKNIGDSLLLSGGLDTGIIAHLASHSRPKCYTVAFSLAHAPDVGFARSISSKLGLDWELVELTPEHLEERLSQVIRVLRTFDPMEVRNSLAVYHGMLAAKEAGSKRVTTGDAADELFAGYSFSFNLPETELKGKLRELWRVMHFSSRPMARSLRMAASIPYLDRAVFDFAKGLEPAQLVGRRGRIKYGKLILRTSFENMVGKRIAWRAKTPIEFGSGTTFLPVYYGTRIDDSSFSEGRKKSASEGVKVRDKEHLKYYEIYRSVFPSPSEVARTDNRCPECGGDARHGSKFCVTCGAYPITPAAAA